jgi:hypothetical protein
VARLFLLALQIGCQTCYTFLAALVGDFEHFVKLAADALGSFAPSVAPGPSHAHQFALATVFESFGGSFVGFDFGHL